MRKMYVCFCTVGCFLKLKHLSLLFFFNAFIIIICLLVLSKSAFVHDRHIFLFHHVVPESKSDFPHFHINVYIQRNI